jgi:hypothetical protein
MKQFGRILRTAFIGEDDAVLEKAVEAFAVGQQGDVGKFAESHVANKSQPVSGPGKIKS